MSGESVAAVAAVLLVLLLGVTGSPPPPPPPADSCEREPDRETVVLLVGVLVYWYG